MKKVIIICLIMVVASTTTFAQFNFGLKAGLNYNTIKAQNNEFEESGVLGYQAGVWARVGKSIYFQPEIYLGSKGSQFTFQTGSGASATFQEAEKNFTTLDVPLLVGKKFGKEGTNFRIMLGPSLQYNLDENSSSFSQASNPNFYKYEDFIVNGQIGAGLDLGSLSLDLRYETSLKDINQNSGQKQSLLHFSLGYKLF
jgi:hypothetical protein